MEKGRIEFIEFSITSLVTGVNSEQNGNVQIFVYITQIAYFLWPFKENYPVAQWRRVGLSFRFYSLNRGETSVQNVNFQILLHKLELCIF